MDLFMRSGTAAVCFSKYLSVHSLGEELELLQIK
jgi:hypothetical protein